MLTRAVFRPSLVSSSAMRAAALGALLPLAGQQSRSYAQGHKRMVEQRAADQRVYMESLGFVADRAVPSIKQPWEYAMAKFRNIIGWWYMKKPQPQFSYKQLSLDTQNLFDGFHKARASADQRGLRTVCTLDLYNTVSASLNKLPPNVRVEWSARHVSKPKVCMLRYIKMQGMPMEICQATVRCNTKQTVKVFKGGEEVKTQEATSSDVVVVEAVTNNPAKPLQWKMLDMYVKYDDKNAGIGYLKTKSLPNA